MLSGIWLEQTRAKVIVPFGFDTHTFLVEYGQKTSSTLMTSIVNEDRYAENTKGMNFYKLVASKDAIKVVTCLNYKFELSTTVSKFPSIKKPILLFIV